MRQVNCYLKRQILLLFIFAAVLINSGFAQDVQDRTKWMKEAKWGVMTHYLADLSTQVGKEQMSVENWNQIIDHFDVEGLAKQLESVGAGYYLITIGQNSGYYLAPNATYDKLVGIQPSKCSRRDLVSDLYEALNKQGVKLIVYLPSGAPAGDQIAVKALEWENGPHRNLQFQLKWEQVIREWSTRWGTKVAGWWFDGCYWSNTMYRCVEPPNFASFAASARAGNPQSVIAFNPGVVDRVLSITPFEDYTAGETNELEKTLLRRTVNGKVDGARIHKLSYLGQMWGTGEPRYKDLNDVAIPWSRKIVDAGGVITWDVPIQKSGLITQPFIDQLATIGKALDSRSHTNRK